MTLSTGGIDVCACRRHTSVSKANEGKRKDWRYDMPTVEVAPRGPRPPIRLRPVPRCDPPFDDELDTQVWASPKQLALGCPGESPPAAREPYGGIGQPGPPDPAALAAAGASEAAPAVV